MKSLALFCISLFSFFTLYAQTVLNGLVVDKSTGIPLTGATIRWNNNKTMSTDNTGSFRIACIKGESITVSYVGFRTNSFEIKDCSQPVKIYLEPASQLIEAVEISATTASSKSLLYQPASITKLSTKELNRGQGLYLDDAIQTNVPGVQMARRTVAGGQQFNIRGYGNGTRGTRGVSSNFDGQGYKVYLNGISITDAEGITTLDDIDFNSLSDVEIIKGPAGTLYGQAIAGAINLKTKTAEKGKTEIAQELLIGNYGTKRLTTSFLLGGEHSSLLLNYGKQSSDGFSWHNQSKKDYVNFTGQFTLHEKQTVTTYIGFTDSYDERLGELTPTQWVNNDYSGNIEYLKRDAHSHIITYRAGVSHIYALNTHFTHNISLFGTGFRSDVSSAGGWTDKTAVNYGLRSTLESRFNLQKGVSLNGISGIEMQRQDAQVLGYSMKQNPFDTTTNGWSMGKPYWVINALSSNTAYQTSPITLFTEWTLNLPMDFSITSGISTNKMKINLDDRFISPTITRPSHFEKSYAGMMSPHIALNKVFKKTISVYVSYSTGYKAPTSSYFFITTPAVTNPITAATARVNQDLKPEKGAQFEIGSKGTIFSSRLTYEFSLFKTEFANKMTSVSVPLNNLATAYSYVVNGGTQIHKGAELVLKYELVKEGTSIWQSIKPFFNMAYADFKYGNGFNYVTGSTTATLDTFNFSSLAVFGVPKIASAVGFDFSTKAGMYGTFSFLHRDGINMGLEKTSNAPKTFVLRTADGYNLLNGKIGYKKQWGKRIDSDWYFGINNITGTKYPLMVFVNQLPDAYLPAPPKAVIYGGVSLHYNIGK